MRVVTTPTYPYGMAILTMHEVGIYYSFGSCLVRSYMAGLLGNIHFKLHSNVYMNTLHDCRVAHLDTSLTLMQISTDSMSWKSIKAGFVKTP